ncbi:MAG: hypothetical protein ACK5U0_13780 [Gemmatimonas sp.]|jgi:hypothetical protein|uniref:hypothetical protein n=2 Tax=Gemmatimonas sp. TaxID=1962908 RepID=UPI0025C67AB5|nr:hypothetical protein [Gemmatimonas sp.]MCA2984169.1 hypothetical protein [Gemmatimonas sp.]MCA2995309.1 hypothetical protein [Gemmatimonas sp.]
MAMRTIIAFLLYRRAPRTAFVGLLVLPMACSGDSFTCTLIGDPTGLTVELPTPMQGPFTVTLLSPRPGLTYTYSCDGGPGCVGTVRVLFAGVVVPQATIRVTTPRGTRDTPRSGIRYEESFPNGRGCEPRALTATVRAELPE